MAAVLAGLLAFALLVTSCTSDEAAAPSPAVPDPRVTGTVLVRSGFGGTFELVELPGREVTPLRMPEYFRTIAAFFDEDGTVVGLLEVPDGARLFRLSPDDEPVALGPRLPVVDTMSHGGGSVLVTRCDDDPFAAVLDLASPGDWVEVDAGCGAALAPGGGAAAWSPDGSTIVQADLTDAAPPSVVAAVRRLPVPQGAGDTSFAGPVAWSKEGRGVLVAASGWQGVASGPRFEALAPVGDRGSGPAQAYLDWQPGGSQLGVASSTTLGGIVRVVDGDRARVVAMFGEPATGVVWSPSGEIVLAASNGVWAIVTTEGEWLWSRIEGGGQEPLDWKPAA